MRKLVTGVAMLCLVAACGDKVPQSEAAKRVGDQPKQTIDKMTSDVNKSLQQGAERLPEAEKDPARTGN